MGLMMKLLKILYTVLIFITLKLYEILKILYTVLIFITLKLYEILILPFYRFGKWCVGNDQEGWSHDFINYKIKYNIIKLFVTVLIGGGISVLYLGCSFVLTFIVEVKVVEAIISPLTYNFNWSEEAFLSYARETKFHPADIEVFKVVLLTETVIIEESANIP